jgi:HD superfamily phosphodiesterase
MTAEQILIDYLNKINLNSDKKTELIAHTERVSKLCREFAEVLNLDKERAALLNDAAWLHDLAKYKKNNEKRKDHYKKVKAAIEEGNYFLENKSVLYNIIEAHSEDFRPYKEYTLEAAVLRICDKLDKFIKKKDDTEEKCENSMKKIKDCFKENRLQLPDEFKITYNKLLRKCKVQ